MDEALIAKYLLMFVAPAYPTYLVGRYTKMKSWQFLVLTGAYEVTVAVATKP